MVDTFSIEENARESERLYSILDGGAREELMKYPGVRHVSVGLKIKGNDMLWERCFHVYVDKKYGAHEISESNMVPLEISGIRTDVHEIGIASAAAMAKSGLKISNGIEHTTTDEQGQVLEVTQFGTIGAVGRDKNRSCNVVALTNWHVLYVGAINISVQAGTRVFQPQAGTTQNGQFDIAPDPDTTDNDVGKVINGIHNGRVDCAVFEVNRSCCNCCGVDYSGRVDRLETISPLHLNGVYGRGRAHAGDAVFFVGAKSGPSKGYVVTDNAPKTVKYSSLLVSDRREVPFPPIPAITDVYSKSFTGQIKIRTDGNHPINGNITVGGNTFSRFVDHGDSGSLLVNSDNVAVGLVFATDDQPGVPGVSPITPTPDPPGVPPLPPGSPAVTLYGYANHYDDVMTALQGIGIQFELKLSNLQADQSNGPETMFSFSEPDSETYKAWKVRVESHPLTRSIADAVLRHRDEVLLLINHCRPVTVAWHRGKGPAYAAAIAGNIRDSRFEYPGSINNIRPEQLLSRMNDVLLEHGSNDLKEDLRRFNKIILEAVKGRNTFEELMAAFTGRAVYETCS